MKHFTSPSFWESFNKLSPQTQNRAILSFNKLKSQSNYPSLHLKKVGRYWSVRIGKKHRAIAVEIETGLLWFWIGTHTDYEQLLK
jgi:hypothetical protein